MTIREYEDLESNKKRLARSQAEGIALDHFLTKTTDWIDWIEMADIYACDFIKDVSIEEIL